MESSGARRYWCQPCPSWFLSLHTAPARATNFQHVSFSFLFYLVTTGWIFDISLFGNSINQSLDENLFKNHDVSCFWCTHHHPHGGSLCDTVPQCCPCGIRKGKHSTPIHHFKTTKLYPITVCFLCFGVPVWRLIICKVSVQYSGGFLMDIILLLTLCY